MNVVLITPDQMRADHLSCYGYNRNTSPWMDKLAQQGTLLTRYYAVGSWTTPTFFSMLSSLAPSSHGATLFGSTPYNPTNPLLSESFERAGYKTAAFCNNANATNPLQFGSDKSTIRGFQELYLGESKLPKNITEHFEFKAYQTNEKVLQWLDQNHNDLFFLWVLYIEPHSPNNTPPDHDIFKTEAYPGEINNGYGPERGSGHLYRLANRGDEKARERLVNLYDGKIHFVDYYVGEVLKKLEELGLDENTMVLLTSDHGELLYEHMDCLTFDHRSLYDSNIHVPFILRGPSVPKGKRIDALANELDLAPTLLDIAGIPPMESAQGKSLLPAINGEISAVNEHVFSEQDVIEPLRSVRDERYKLIHNLRDGKCMLYDSLNDLREQSDIAEEQPEICQELFGRLAKHMEEIGPSEESRINHWRKFTLKDEIIDEVTIGSRLQLFGFKYEDLKDWVKLSEGGNCYKDHCYWIEPGDGSRGASWRSDNPLLGNYNIYLWYGKLPDRSSATNASFTLITRTDSKTYSIDQNYNWGKWNLLGNVENPVEVRVTNDANGPVVIDAVRFEKKD